MIKASANAGDVRSAEETAYRARGGISVEPSHRCVARLSEDCRHCRGLGQQGEIWKA